MARKKKPSRKAPAKPVRSFMRPEWRRRIFGEGGPRELPPRTSAEAAERTERARQAALPAWLRPFEIFRPTPEETAERARWKKASLVESMVPRSELEYIEKMKRSHAAPGSSRYGYGPAPGESRYGAPSSATPSGQSRYGPPPPAARPRGGTQAAGAFNPIDVFDLDAVWDGLRRVRSDPRFRGTYGVGQISKEGRTQAERALDTAAFFKAPEELVRRYRPETLWLEWAEPVLRSVSDELNHLKPPDIKGRLKFDLAENGAFGLVYVE